MSFILRPLARWVLGPATPSPARCGSIKRGKLFEGPEEVSYDFSRPYGSYVFWESNNDEAGVSEEI